MGTRRNVFFLLALFAAPVLAGPGASTGKAADSWPSIAGPQVVDAGKVFDPEGFGLEVAFNIPLGSAYSGIAVAAGKAVTMFSDGTHDVMAALDASTGRELWRFRIEETYRGHDGSDDGPLSSPVIGGGIAYGLGARGRLFAVSLEDGKKIWERNLTDDLGGVEPEYGYTTTPLLEGKMLIVQPGGAGGRVVAALDRATGEHLWSALDGEVLYQSPAVLELAGRRQIVVITSEALHGLDPADGTVLWSADHPEEMRSGKATATPLGDDRFVVDYWNGLAAYTVKRDGDAYATEVLWSGRDMRGAYSPPVVHEGHLYGFSGDFLTCVNAQTGERVWKSRPPGGRSVIGVGGRLIILANGGVAVVADASPEGYVERARMQLFERGGLTKASFRDGRFYVRNLTGMAALSISRAMPGRPEERPRVAASAGKFAEWVRAVEAAEDREAMVAELLAEIESFPIVEEDRYVHFVYHGEAGDVAVVGDMTTSGRAEALTRIEGTGLFYRSYPIEPGARWDYRFQVDFEEVVDPRNPRLAPDRWDDEGRSEVVTSSYAAPDFLREPEGERGKLETFEFHSKLLENDRQVTVYLPRGYGSGGERYPVLYLTDGQRWVEKAQLPVALDNLTGSVSSPVIAVFVHPIDGRYWEEEGGSRTAEYARMLVEELVPEIDGKYRTRKDRRSRAITGTDGGGFAAAYAAFHHPEVFGKLAVQSIQIDGDIGEDLLAYIARGGGKKVEVYVGWNRYEDHDHEHDYDYAEYSRRFVAALDAGGYRHTGGEALSTTGWGAWRARSDDILMAFFPAEGGRE